jgi:hypothetical protein
VSNSEVHLTHIVATTTIAKPHSPEQGMRRLGHFDYAIILLESMRKKAASTEGRFKALEVQLRKGGSSLPCLFPL